MISIKIKDPLFTYRAQLVNILDFNCKKLSIEKYALLMMSKNIFTILNTVEILFIYLLMILKVVLSIQKKKIKQS